MPTLDWLHREAAFQTAARVKSVFMDPPYNTQRMGLSQQMDAAVR